MNRLNKTESAVFLYFRFFLCLKDLFFPDYLKMYENVDDFNIIIGSNGP